MLKEFYSTPKIDVETYDPLAKTHSKCNGEAEEIFKGTDVYDPVFRKNYIKHKNKKVYAPDFVEENMGQWPVIFVSFASVSFETPTPTNLEILLSIFETAIQPAFRSFDYIIYLSLLRRGCSERNLTPSKESFRKLHIDLGLDYYETTTEKIMELYKYHGWNMTSEYKTFYRLYTGTGVTKKDILDSLRILDLILYEFYEKEKVIILVDEHDAGAHNLYKEFTFENEELNKKIMRSISYYSKLITLILRRVGKDSPNYTEKFLACGISNSIIREGISGFNNVKVKNVFDTEYSG